MVKLVQGDILKAHTDALVNTVNCVGVMGRGIALQFRKAFPDNFEAYKNLCGKKQLHPGQVFVYDLARFESPRYVINFPTKRHWKGKSKLEDIEAGLEALVREIRDRGIRSVAVPPLGCGLGGLDWNVVRPMIENAFASLPGVEVEIYEPKGAPEPEAMVDHTEAPAMTPGRAALLGLMRRYLGGLMDTSVSLLEIHKLMYFLQEAGEPLRLDYVKGLYGPYAKNLRHVLIRLEGHFVTGYGDAEDKPERKIELRPEASDLAEDFLKEHEDTRARLDQVGNLIAGFETPYGMELLSTVYWVGTREGAKTQDEALAKTYEWGERKKMFRPEHVQVAWRVLKEKGWLSTQHAPGGN